MKNIYKYIKIVICFFAINTILIYTDKVSANPYMQTSSYGTNCTWYAWKMAYEKAGVSLPGWGNAKDWYNDAIKSGYKVGTEPASNSIVVWGGWTSYGHVGYVEKVDENTIYVWDSTGPCIDEKDPEFLECIANAVDESTDRLCVANAKSIACEYTLSPDEYGITGYIYLDYAPSTPINTVTPNNNSNNNGNNTNSQKQSENPVKSNNAFLKELSFDTGNIEFSKDIFEYSLEVENAISKIIISAISEDNKAVITGIGDYELSVGLNEINITVTAEDGSINVYLVKITRNEKEEVNYGQVTNDDKEDVKESNEKEEVNYNIIILIIIVCLFLILLSVTFTCYKLKKRGKK